MEVKIPRLMIAIVISVFMTLEVFGQEMYQPVYISVQKMHWNMDKKDFKMEDWVAMEKEFLDKVIQKNDLIIASNVLLHSMTPDNTELLYVTVYNSWDAIEKAADKNGELIRAAWPDVEKRRAFFTNRRSYYDESHSDEIFMSYPGAKSLKKEDGKRYYFYVRKNYMAFPEGGSADEFDSLSKEYIENVFHKNNLIKAYYPHVHLYGTNSRDFIEVFVVESMADLEKMFESNDKLYKEHWPDEAKRKDMEAKMEKYFLPNHSDYLYRLVPELSKG